MIRLTLNFAIPVLLLTFFSVSPGSAIAGDKSQSDKSTNEKAQSAKPQKQPQVTVVAVGGGAAGQVVVGRTLGGRNGVVPDKVDANDRTERVLLLLSQAPLLVELNMTIDGKPFRTSREALIDRLWKTADTDKDGKLKWDEALASRRFLTGRFSYLARNDQTKQSTIKQYDTNKDGLIDRGELRRLVARMNGGATFYVQPSYQSNGQGSNSAIRTLLDTDKDGDLSAEEIAAAPGRLKIRDADDSDVLDQAELGLQAYRGGYRNVRGSAGSRPQGLLLGVSEGANWDGVHKALLLKYGQKESLETKHIAGSAALAKALDENNDGKLDVEELKRLAQVEPDLKLEIQLGETGKQPAGLKVIRTAENLTSAEPLTSDGTEPVKIQFAGTNVLLHVSTAKPQYSAARSAQSMFNRYDKDKNGYLEKTELGTQGQGLASQFDSWDANTDGKVFVDEIQEYYQAMQEPMWNRVAVGAVLPRDPMFQALDTSGDTRLGLREMRGASERLKSLDKNGDGQLTAVELPESIRFGVARAPHIGRILSSGQTRQMFVRQVPGQGTAAPPEGTSWFTRMDRNSDGDLSKREFLGTDEQFKKLDQDGDGLIDAKEAKSKSKD